MFGRLRPAAGLAALAILASPLAADEPPLMRPEDKILLTRQSEELAEAAGEATRALGDSVVWVRRNGEQVALGTVIGDGSRVLTKWSEVGGIGPGLSCMTADGRVFAAQVSGVYEADDIAVLGLAQGKLAPVKWSSAPTPRPGRFLLAVQPTGKPAALGVVGVEERSLRESDQAFLGVRRDINYEGRGVKVDFVEEGSGAEAGGLKPGDVVLRVGDRRVNGFYELRTALAPLRPGAIARLLISRAGEESEIDVKLGSRRAEFRQFPAARLKAMEAMAGPAGVSRVGDGFPEVIQTDMKILPKLCGSPVIDLDGQVAGIAIARATRTRSFVIPASRVAALLEQPATDPELATIGGGEGERVFPRARVVRPRGEPGGRPAPRPRPQRRRVDELQRLLEQFLEEMDALDGR
jgi:S1-C subfamily serine protease